MAKSVTKSYEITADELTLIRFERLLTMLHSASVEGHSGLFAMWLDGDGIDEFVVNPSTVLDRYRKGALAVSNVGYPVEVASDGAFHGKFINEDYDCRWIYNDEGEDLPGSE